MTEYRPTAESPAARIRSDRHNQELGNMKFNGRDVHISHKAKIGRNVRIGDNSVVYDNVEVGDNSVICNDTVIGEPLNAYYHDPTYQNPPTVIGPDSIVRSHSIIYAGSTIGAAFSAGHHVTIRENTTIGERCSVGTLSDLEGDINIGKYCRLHSNVHISQHSSMGDFVWMFPYSVMTNDPYPPSNEIKGPYVGSYSLVCVHAVILAGVRVGENCLIGANSVVNKTLKDFSLATGNPLKVMDIRKYAVIGKGKLYPWMNRFDRGMPWQGMGYDAWIKNQ
jgi:acetyltransferase-like isoleucine patch superfamily enzyme